MLFALAAQFSATAPTNTRLPTLQGLISGADVPEYLATRGQVDLTVYTRITVSPDGKIQGCVVEYSSGDPRLDAYTCALIEKRANFSPPRWVDGSAAYGVIRSPVRWQVSELPRRNDSVQSDVPDLDLSVNQLPEGAHSPLRVNLELAADEKGHAVSCTERPLTAAAPSSRFPELISLACQQATASMVLSPPLDPSGKPARSVQSVSVRFEVGK